MYAIHRCSSSILSLFGPAKLRPVAVELLLLPPLFSSRFRCRRLRRRRRRRRRTREAAPSCYSRTWVVSFAFTFSSGRRRRRLLAVLRWHVVKGTGGGDGVGGCSTAVVLNSNSLRLHFCCAAAAAAAAVRLDLDTCAVLPHTDEPFRVHRDSYREAYLLVV